MLDKVKINSRSIVHLSLTVCYDSDQGRHTDTMHFEKFNVWRNIDLLPAEIQKNLIGQQAGYQQSWHYSSGELLMSYNDELIHTISSQQFNRHPRPGLAIEPRLGRFYPRGWFGGIAGTFSEDMHPARLVGFDADKIQVEFNHPLAGNHLEVLLQVYDVSCQCDEHGGCCSDSMADLLSGPGMQLRNRGQGTDFMADDSFQRADVSLDGAFYSKPRLVNHLDATALHQLLQFYKQIIPPQAKLLDLMSSVHSHLADEITTSYVAGLGMNQRELEANPRLDDCIIHDLNQDSVLPFDNESFDIVLCSLSVEYLIKPQDVFAEVARVLRPDGQLVISFSNRWFPAKAITLWTQLHEFERMGLVSEYFLDSGCFDNINTWSMRGLSRPRDDHYALPLSDPLYAVWGTRK